MALLFYQAKNLLKYTGSSLQNWRNKCFCYSTKYQKTLHLLCRFEEINIFIILPSKRKIPKYTGSSLQIWKNKYFYQSTKHKKKLPKYNGSSLQNWKKKCAKDDLKKPPWISWVFWASKFKTQDAYLRTEIRVDFNIHRTKYFKGTVFHQK